MIFKNLNSGSDKQAQYSYVRKEMANKYVDENLFGLGSDILNLPFNFKELSSQFIEKVKLDKNFLKL
jgi:hypothetical protein